MKSQKLTGIRRMELYNVPVPEIKKEDEVLIRMTHVGVCGSDIHYYTQGRIGSQVVAYPFSIGHEGAGIIEKVGKVVGRFGPGDRVAIDPAMWCHHCDQCVEGRHHTCRNLRFLGCPGQAEGCLSEYVVMPQDSCFRIPDSMSLEEAALVEPLSIGYYATTLAGKKEPYSCAILGFGPIGMSVFFSLRSKGVQNIYITDKLDYRLEHAKMYGARYTGNPEKKDIVKDILSYEPLQLDVVFECCGQQDAICQAVELLKPGGKLVLVGIPETDTIVLPIDLMRRKELVLQNVRRQRNSVVPAIELISGKTMPVASMVTHRFSLDEAKEAFDLVAAYADKVMKAMIVF